LGTREDFQDSNPQNLWAHSGYIPFVACLPRKLLYRWFSDVMPSFSYDEVHHTLFWQWRSSADCTLSGVQLALWILTLFISYSAQSQESELSCIFVLGVSSLLLFMILLLDIEMFRQYVILCFSFFLLIIEILQFLSKVIFFHIKNKILLSLA
jgi:hypothetical protein